MKAVPQRAAGLATAAVALILLCYLPALNAPFFIVDDYQYVVDNTGLQRVPFTQAWRIFTSAHSPWEYLPVRDLSYRLDFALFGVHPLGFRMHNLVLYALCCLAVWFCAMSLQKVLVTGDDNRAPWLAACAVALFAAHPAHVESVAWVAGRKDLLSGLLALLSLWMFSTGYSSASRVRLFASYVLFLLAVLSKSAVVGLPLAALLFAMVADGTGRPKLVRPLAATAPLFLAAALSVALQVFCSETSALRLETLSTHPWRPETWDLPTRILGTLTRIALLPVRLRLTYDVQEAGWPGWMTAALGGVTTVMVVVATWQVVRHRSVAGFGVAVFGYLALPFLQIIPFNTWSYASERFLFLPLLGLSLAIAAWFAAKPCGLRTAAVALVFVAWSGLTVARANEWSSVASMLRRNAERAPANSAAARIYIQYALLKEQRFSEAHAVASRVRDPNDRAFLQQYVTAMECLHEGNLPAVRNMAGPLLAASPREEYSMRMDLANMAMEAGLYTQAESTYRAILEEAPARAEARYNLGLVLAREGRHAEGAAAIETAIENGFVSAVAWNNLGLCYKNGGEPVRAAAAFEAALGAEPAYWHAAYNLARLRLAQGDVARAREALILARSRAVLAGDATATIDQLLRATEPPR